MKNTWKCGLRCLEMYWRWSGVVVLLMLLVGVPAQAIWLGQSQVNPYLEVQEIYESNLYLAAEDSNAVEEGLITVISPGVHAEFPNTEDAMYRFSLDYRSDFRLYDKHGDADIDPDEELNSDAHRIGGKVEMNLTSGFGFAGGYTLNLNSQPPDAPGDTREFYTRHDFMALAKYAFVDRYAVEITYNGSQQTYDEDFDDDDTTTHNVDATLFYRLFPTLTVLGGGGYGIVERQESDFLDISNSTEYRAYGGVRLDTSERLTGEFRVGVASRSFDDDDVDDATTVYLAGQLISQLSETTRLTVGARREFDETSRSGETSANGTYAIETGVQGEITHTLAVLPRLSLHGMAGFTNTEYPEDTNDRSDDAFQFGIGADYKLLKYLIFGAEYIHLQRDSSLDVEDYSADRAMLSVRAIL